MVHHLETMDVSIRCHDTVSKALQESFFLGQSVSLSDQ